MAQMSNQDFDARETDESKNENRRSSSGSFKFNVAAPEFVPTLAAQTLAPATAQVPITGYFYPCFQSIDGTTGSWIYISDQEITIPLVQTKPNGKVGSAHIPQHQPQAKEIALSDELKQKIIKQVLFFFLLSCPKSRIWIHC